MDDEEVDGSLRVKLLSGELDDLAGNPLSDGTDYTHEFLFFRGDFDLDDDVDADDIDLLFRAVYNGNAPVGT